MNHFIRAKIFLQRNEVYDNRNFIPFFNEGGVNTEDHARPDYGTEAQTYIIDGSGVYVTRNSVVTNYSNYLNIR